MGWTENNYDYPIDNGQIKNVPLNLKIAVKTGKIILIPLLSKEKLFERFKIENLKKSKMSGSSNSVMFGNTNNNMAIAIRSSINPVGYKKEDGSTQLKLSDSSNEEELLIKKKDLLKRTRDAWKFANDNGLCPKVLFFGYYYEKDEIYSCIISERYHGSMFDYFETNCDRQGICDQLTQQIIALLNKMTNGGYICYDIKPENTVYRTADVDNSKTISDVRLIDWDGDFCINDRSAKDYKLISRLIMASHFKRFDSNLFNNNEYKVFSTAELYTLYSGIDDFKTDRILRKVQVENYFPELKSKYDKLIKDGTDILINKENEFKIFLLEQLKKFTPEGYKCENFINVNADCTPKEDEIRTPKITKKKNIFKRFVGKGGNRSTKKKSKSKKTKTRKCK